MRRRAGTSLALLLGSTCVLSACMHGTEAGEEEQPKEQTTTEQDEDEQQQETQQQQQGGDGYY